MPVDEKILDKLSKLKAMADGAAQIGSEAEAEAFAEMLQKLLLKHRVSMSDLDFAKMEKDEPVQEHWIDYDKYGVPLKKTRVVWIEMLSSIVAKAHFCRILVHRRSSRITLVGRQSDTQVAEYMIITLQRAVDRLSDKAAYHYRLEVTRRDGNGKAANGFRDAWLMSFIRRLSERYEAERRAQSGEGENSMALVRINKSEQAVKDYLNRNTKKAAGLKITRSANAEGEKRGRAAADAINLRANAVGDGPAAKQIR